MEKSKTAILGGGITGLSAALHLKGNDFLLLEREAERGGLCRSVRRGDFLFDYTGHLLHLKTEYGQELVERLLKGNLNKHTRRAAIFSKGVWTAYPFQANTYGLPEEVCRECVEGIRAVEGCPVDRSSFLSWIESVFGEGIARHFMIPYNEKLWCVPLDRLSCGWVGDYIPRPTVAEVEEGSRSPAVARAFGYNADFLYPERGGIQSLIDGMVSEMGEERRTRLQNQSEAVEINTERKEIRLQDGRMISYERLINTIPLKQFIVLCSDAPSAVREAAETLEAVSVYNLNLGVKGNRSDLHWAYFPEKKEELPFYRLGFYHNFGEGMAPPDTSSYYAEIAFRQGERPNLEGLRERVLKGLRRLGLIDKESDILVEFSTVIETAYVLYTHDRGEKVNLIMEWLKERGIHSTGRYGAWEYSAMEEALLEGRLAAEWAEPR